VFALTAIDTALPPPLTPEQSAERLARVVPPRTSPRLRIAYAAAVTAAVAAAVLIPGVPFRDDGSSVTVLPSSVVKVDPARNKVVASIAVGGEPGQPRVLAGGVFVTSVKNR
jgi:hypothetical protein